MTALFSEEGLSALAARAATAQYFEWANYTEISADENSSSYQTGQAFGKLFGAVTAYHI